MRVRNDLPTHFHLPYQRHSIAFQRPSLSPPYTPRGVGRRWNAPLRTGLNASTPAFKKARWPACADLFARKRDVDRAEACLIGFAGLM
jgi:hypothetical protein